jgi:hypothetical protein
MDARKQLKLIAVQLANDHLERAKSLEPELYELKMRLAQIEAQLDAAKLYHKRLPQFVPEVGGDFQCPGCWVLHEAKVALRPVSSEADDDYFRCPRCERSFVIEV